MKIFLLYFTDKFKAFTPLQKIVTCLLPSGFCSAAAMPRVDLTLMFVSRSQCGGTRLFTFFHYEACSVGLSWRCIVICKLRIHHGLLARFIPNGCKLEIGTFLEGGKRVHYAVHEVLEVKPGTAARVKGGRDGVAREAAFPRRREAAAGSMVCDA